MSIDRKPLLELRDVSLHYRRQRRLRGSRDHQVLNEVSFPVYAGETLGIIGRNGAGKTSVLKLLAGIIAPDTGQVLRHTENVCLLSYQLGFNQFLSGRQNAVHTAMLQGMSRREIERRMDAVAEFSGLEEALDEPLSTYSTGMRARLGFAVSLQLDPDVLLIDEALGVGDYEFKQRSAQVMRERMRSNKTVVVVSHDPFTIKELCDRAVWIENGEVVLQDMPERVMEQYHKFDRFVTALADATGETKTAVRAKPINADPLAFMQRLTADLREAKQRQRQDYFSERAAGGVLLQIPQRMPVLSSCMQEDCGSWCWIENCRQVMRGDRASVESAYADFDRMLYKIGMELKQDPVSLRGTDVYRQLVSLLDDLADSQPSSR